MILGSLPGFMNSRAEDLLVELGFEHLYAESICDPDGLDGEVLRYGARPTAARVAFALGFLGDIHAVHFYWGTPRKTHIRVDLLGDRGAHGIASRWTPAR